MTAVDWLERDYDTVFADGQEIVAPDFTRLGLRLITYAPDPMCDRPGPLLSFKVDDPSGVPRWPEAAMWPLPYVRDDLDNPLNQEGW